MRPLFLLALLELCGCPTPGPAPMPPDATDASPIFPEAGPLPQPPEAAPPQTFDGATTSACFRACQALQAVGCREGSGSCITRLQVISDGKLEPNRANRNLPLTCDDLSKVKTASDVVATGQPCTPVGDR